MKAFFGSVAVRKFAKYAMVIMLTETLPVIARYLDSASGLSTVPWGAMWDSAGLVALKSCLGGGIGSYLNLAMPGGKKG